MPYTPIINFDAGQIPDTNDEASFHSDATYVFDHMASEIIPKFNSNLDWFGTAIAGSETVVDAVGVLTSQIAGRNIVINGSGRVNQRGYVSGAATTSGNQFTLDRWFVAVSGQNLAFIGTAAGSTMTAPPNGVSTVIEGGNVKGGTYVINWVGLADCAVNGVTRAKGDTFTLSAGNNAVITFFNNTFTDVQVELGTVPTPFEFVDLSVELGRCQRYYEEGRMYHQSGSTVEFTGGMCGPMLMQKRATPSVSLSIDASSGYVGSLGLVGVTISSVGFNARLSAGSPFILVKYIATSELTS